MSFLLRLSSRSGAHAPDNAEFVKSSSRKRNRWWPLAKADEPFAEPSTMQSAYIQEVEVEDPLEATRLLVPGAKEGSLFSLADPKEIGINRPLRRYEFFVWAGANKVLTKRALNHIHTQALAQWGVLQCLLTRFTTALYTSKMSHSPFTKSSFHQPNLACFTRTKAHSVHPINKPFTSQLRSVPIFPLPLPCHVTLSTCWLLRGQ